MVIDDAWYVMLAKALAEGRGYWLVNAPLDGILPGYPPGFPALLSLVFYLRPEFPDNVWLLKSVSIAAMLGVAMLSYSIFMGCGSSPVTSPRLPRSVSDDAGPGVPGDVDSDVGVRIHTDATGSRGAGASRDRERHRAARGSPCSPAYLARRRS